MNHILLWLRRCHFPLLLLLGAAPVALLLLYLWDPTLIASGCALYAVCLLLSAACAALSGRRRLIAGSGCALALFALGCALLPIRARPSLLAIPLGVGALLMASLPLSSRGAGENSPTFYFSGLIAHIFTYALFHTSLASRIADAQSAQILTILFAAYMALFLLALNRISLNNATLARHAAARFMRVINVALTLAFLALSFLLACVPALARLVHRAWLALRAVMAQLNEWLMSLLPHDTGFSGTLQAGMTMPEQAVEQTKPGLFSIILEHIATALAVIALILGISMLLRLIAKGFVRLARYLSARLRLYVAAATEDYIDEITDTREDGAHRESRLSLRIKRRSRTEAETPGERIRALYAHLLRRKPQWPDSSTARENLPEEAAALYERARYSDHEAAQEDEDRFRADIRSIR